MGRDNSRRMKMMRTEARHSCFYNLYDALETIALGQVSGLF